MFLSKKNVVFTQNIDDDNNNNNQFRKIEEVSERERKNDSFTKRSLLR